MGSGASGWSKPKPVVGRQLARLSTEAGRITRRAADTWPADLTSGPFLAAFALFRVTVSAV